ncbi:hypothetical protein [Nocardioides marmoraquaticus]
MNESSLRQARDRCKSYEGSTAPVQVIGGLAALVEPSKVTSWLAIKAQINKDEDHGSGGTKAMTWSVTWLTDDHIAHATARRSGDADWTLRDSRNKVADELAVSVWPIGDLSRVSVTQVDAYYNYEEWSVYPVYEAHLRDGTVIAIPSLAESAEQPFVKALLAVLGRQSS